MAKKIKAILQLNKIFGNIPEINERVQEMSLLSVQKLWRVNRGKMTMQETTEQAIFHINLKYVFKNSVCACKFSGCFGLMVISGRF